MAKLTLRFYGRFLCAVELADGAPTGVIKLVAPKFDRRFRSHTTFLSIPTMSIDTVRTDVQPSLLMSAPQNPEGARAETVMWELTGRELRFADAASAPPSATVGVSPHSPEFPLLDLNDLVDRVQLTGTPAPAVLDLGALRLGDKTQSLVTITRGRGMVHRVLRPEFTRGLTRRKIGDEGHLVTVKDATDAAGPDNDVHFGAAGQDGSIGEIGMGEVVEFEFDVIPLDPFTLEVFDYEGSRTGRISVRAVADDQTLTLSFSNLCASLPTNENYDLEFEQYYSALTPATNPGELALVPKPADDGGEPASCQAPAMVQFERSSGATI